MPIRSAKPHLKRREPCLVCNVVCTIVDCHISNAATICDPH